MKKIFLLSLLLLTLDFTLSAQETRSHQLTITGGYTTQVVPDVDESFHGYHFGLNRYKRNIARIGWDSQFSFNLVSDYEARISVMALIGGRIYFNATDNKRRYFFNLLAGPAFNTIIGDDYTEIVAPIGYSGGFHMSTKKIQLGLSIERQEVYVFKIGYHLGTQ